MTAVDLQKTAQELFDREQFLEASNQCDLILGKEPQNEIRPLAQEENH